MLHVYRAEMCRPLHRPYTEIIRVHDENARNKHLRIYGNFRIPARFILHIQTNMNWALPPFVLGLYATLVRKLHMPHKVILPLSCVLITFPFRAISKDFQVWYLV